MTNKTKVNLDSIQSASSVSSSVSTSSFFSRKWIKVSKAIYPLIWYGLLPLLGLLMLAWWALSPFAKNDMEDTVRREIVADFAKQGNSWVNVDVSGQNVTLSGAPPKIGDGDAAISAARATLCPSFVGKLVCAVAVKGNFEVKTADAAPAPVPVPVLEPRTELVKAAESCENSMAQLLKDQHIKFATGSSNISTSSASVLDALVAKIKQCPEGGKITVEGHTDSVGVATSNKSLSQARADAVVSALASRGVEKGRLDAQGFGSDNPLASNDSAQGRAQNRRITFRVKVN